MAEGPSTDLGIAGLGPAVRIGSGGFADVYRAQQTNLRREVAVKVLRAPANEDQARMRFERECHAVGAVSGHPNIVAVHEGGFTADGRAYLVMEYFPGGALLDRIETHGKMTAVEVIDIGLKIGRALGVAHDAGVLHRDVKPANILVSAYGEPALADFGIARVEGGQQTATGSVTASLAHASPEVLEGGPPSAASDLYSLGSTLFELFTGHPPHFQPGEESVWALMNRVVSNPIPDPVSLGMPQPLASVVARATNRDPSLRHPSANDFVQELSGVVPSATGRQPGTVLAAPPTTPTPSVPPHPPGAPPTQVVSDESPTTTYSATEQQPPTVPTALAQPQGLAPPQGLAQPTVAGADATVGQWAQSGAAQHATAQGSPSTPGYQPGHGLAAHDGGERSKRSKRPLMIGAFLVVAIAAAIGTFFAVQRFTTDTAASVVFDFPAGSTGPLDEGVSYDLAVDGALTGTRFRLVLDGEAQGEPAVELEPFVAPAGRHSIAIEVTDSDGNIRESDPIEIYGIGPLPEAGFRANLESRSSTASNWPNTIRRVDELLADGHTDVSLLPSDRFANLQPGFWNLFVPGFGDDRAAALAYCDSFSLAVPDECFVSFFDPNA